jgi:hypothetical protein
VRVESPPAPLVSAVIGALGRHRLHVLHDPASRRSQDLSQHGAVRRRARSARCPIPTSLPCGPRPASLRRRTIFPQHPPVAGRWIRTSVGRIRTTMDATWRDVLLHGSPTLQHSDAVRDPLRLGKSRVCFGSRVISSKTHPTNTFSFSHRPERNVPCSAVTNPDSGPSRPWRSPTRITALSAVTLTLCWFHCSSQSEA